MMCMIQSWKKPGAFKQAFRFLGFLGFFTYLGLIYEDGTQNYDPDIHEEYLIHDTPFVMPHQTMAIINTAN